MFRYLKDQSYFFFLQSNQLFVVLKVNHNSSYSIKLIVVCVETDYFLHNNMQF